LKKILTCFREPEDCQHQGGAGHGDLLDGFLVHLEDLFPLRHAGGIVHMHDHVRRICPANRFECLLDDMFSCLGQNLNGHIIGDQILLDKFPAEFIFRVAGCRKTDFDFLEAYPDQFFIEFNLFIKVHGNNQCLISVPKIHAAPDRCLIHVFLVHPIGTGYRRHVIASSVMLIILHVFSLHLIGLSE
jgi:hypothetical protein